MCFICSVIAKMPGIVSTRCLSNHYSGVGYKKEFHQIVINQMRGRMVFYWGLISCIFLTGFKPNFPVSNFSNIYLCFLFPGNKTL